jgi:hypothetical protein
MWKANGFAKNMNEHDLLSWLVFPHRTVNVCRKVPTVHVVDLSQGIAAFTAFGWFLFQASDSRMIQSWMTMTEYSPW